jgi:molecular chaperone GrpE
LLDFSEILLTFFRLFCMFKYMGDTETENQEQNTEMPIEEACSESADATPEVETAEAEPRELTPEERVSQLEDENADLKDQLLRRAADFDNYRKRMIREKQEAFDYANSGLLGDLLDSLDNMERALEAASTAADIKTVVDGISMVKNQLSTMLESKYDLKSYGAEGDLFDPNEHEAIARIPADPSVGLAEPVCSAIYLKGYKLKDRVIRHAKVQVTMPETQENK